MKVYKKLVDRANVLIKRDSVKKAVRNPADRKLPDEPFYGKHFGILRCHVPI